MKPSMTATQQRQPNAYLKTKIMTASPAQLRGMLLDGAVRFAHEGRAGLAEKNYEVAFNGIHRCQQILLELLEALDPAVDRQLCERLSGLYVFLYTQLMKAVTERDITIVDEVISLLNYECETWRLVMKKITPGTASGKESAPRGRDTSGIAPASENTSSTDVASSGSSSVAGRPGAPHQFSSGFDSAATDNSIPGGILSIQG